MRSPLPTALRVFLCSAMLAVMACGSETPSTANGEVENLEMAAPGFRTEEVSVDGPSGRLGGIKTLPAKAKTDAVALIIPGSGPTDRDGNNPMGVSASTYRLLSEALAERGVASLRIDKRGMFSSEGAGDPNAVTLADYAEDIAAWAQVLDSDCVVLVGHSEGGLVALKAAATQKLCGVALLTVPGRRLGDVLREQLKANPANLFLIDDAEAAIVALERGERVDTSNLHPALQPLFADSVQGFMIDLMAFNAAATVRTVDVPLLVVGGSDDIQVARADYDVFAPFADRAVWVEGMSHVLKLVQGQDRAANLRTYSDPALPLSNEVADEVADFVEVAEFMSEIATPQ